jgi:cob(I)alamin adenosyltransferase
MPRLTRITTRKGDDGSTSLGNKRRVGKDNLRVEAYGTVDELNSVLGLARAAGVDEGLSALLGEIQNDLFHLGTVLSCPANGTAKPLPRIEARHVQSLEAKQERLLARLKPLENFILPGGTLGAAQLQVARCVCRRAERAVVRLRRREKTGEFVVPYLNRLGDLLFVMARYENLRRHVSEVLWDSRA